MDDTALLDSLHALVVASRERGVAPADFWAEFDRLAGDLGERAFADDAPADLREGYTTLLAVADDAGFAVPIERV